MLAIGALLCAAQLVTVCKKQYALTFWRILPVSPSIILEESARDRSMRAHGSRAALKACCR